MNLIGTWFPYYKIPSGNQTWLDVPPLQMMFPLKSRFRGKFPGASIKIYSLVLSQSCFDTHRCWNARHWAHLQSQAPLRFAQQLRDLVLGSHQAINGPLCSMVYRILLMKTYDVPYLLQYQRVSDCVFQQPNFRSPF